MAFKWIATSALVLHAMAPAWELHRLEASEPHMGTLFRVVVYAADETAGRVAIKKAFERAADLDQKLSDYKPDSELNQLCRAPAGKPVVVSSDLLQVVAASLRIARTTDGAFDITVGPLTHQWREARKAGRLPSAAEINEARARTSYRKIGLDARGKTVTLKQQSMQLDLGGIAKGYAADQILAVLTAEGFGQSLVAASGDIRVGAAPPGRDGWMIALESGEKLELVNQAVSTAGAAEQFIEWNGVRYSHILDPRTGVGLTNGLTVSVVAPTGLLADGWDTALCVMGERGKARFLKVVPVGRAFFRRSGARAN